MFGFINQCPSIFHFILQQGCDKPHAFEILNIHEMIVGVVIHPLWLNTGPVIAEESSPVFRTRKMIKRTKKARRTTRRTTRQVAVSTSCDLHPIWEMVSNPHITGLKMVEPRGHQLTHFAYILRMVAV